MAHLVVAHLVGRDAVGGVDDGEVDAGIGQALGIELRQHAGGAVDGVFARRRRPEHGAMALGVARPAHLLEPGGDLGPADLADEVLHRPFAFEQVGVGVDHRVIEPRPHRRRGAVLGVYLPHLPPPVFGPARAPGAGPRSQTSIVRILRETGKLLGRGAVWGSGCGGVAQSATFHVH